MTHPIFQVNAFTDRPFAGNPAAVCILPAPQPDRWMQNIAQEMNLSETAFLVKQEQGYSLRWFTPTVEVDLCGHATLASAHILWTEGHLPPNAAAQFHTRSGLLTARRHQDWIELNFPAKSSEPIAPPPDLLPALGIPANAAQYIGKNQFDYLIEINSETTLRQLQPNHSLLKTLPVRGVIVTSIAAPPYDFVSRFFAPGAGIAEDPVTGSAHCALVPYYHDRLQKTNFLAYQASPRGGILKLAQQADRVLISGQATTILRGELTPAALASSPD